MEVGRHRVPVEHRVLGLDRRAFPYALAALGVWLFWVVLVPWVDDAVPWTDEVRPGDVFQVTDTVTMTPAAGWGVQGGLRTTDRTDSGETSGDVVLVTDGVAFQVTSGPWTGTPAALLDQATVITGSIAGGQEFRVTDAAATVQTRSGDVGVVEGFSTARAEGLIAALVYGGEGLQIQAVGTQEQLAAHSREINEMIASFTDDGSPR